jgi:hypothetical protein
MIGGTPVDYMQNPNAGRQPQFGNAALDNFLGLLLNRTDALIRENIELRARLSKLDGVPIPMVPGHAAPEPAVAPPERDPFAAAVEMAAKAGRDAVPTNGTSRLEEDVAHDPLDAEFPGPGRDDDQ